MSAALDDICLLCEVCGSCWGHIGGGGGSVATAVGHDAEELSGLLATAVGFIYWEILFYFILFNAWSYQCMDERMVSSMPNDE